MVMWWWELEFFVDVVVFDDVDVMLSGFGIYLLVLDVVLYVMGMVGE